MRIRDIADAPLTMASLSADRWSGTGTQLAATASGLDALSAFPGWEGAAATTMGDRVLSGARRVRTVGDAATTTGTLLEAHVAVLGGIQKAVQTTIAVAEGAGMRVHDNGLVTSGTVSATGVGMAALDAVPGVGQAVDAAEAALTATLRGAMAAVQGLDASFAAQVAGAAGISVDRPDSPGAVDPGVEGTSAMSPDGLVDGVRIDAALAASLTPEVRAEVLESAGAAVEQLRARGLDPAEIGVEVVSLSGQLGVVTGDIDAAGTVTTLVSGTGSSDMGGLRESAALAGRITGPGQATVAWHGYQAPASLPAAVLSGRAETGGVTLRGFQQQLRDRNPDARLRVVGHSYGTRVIDEAAGDGATALEADEVHLWGSPGMTAGSAADLNLHALDGDAEVHVYKDRQDVIGTVADIPFLHGADPSDPEWGADFTDGTARSDRSRWDSAQDALVNAPGPVGALGTGMRLVDTAGDVLGSLWGLLDGDLGDEHGSYRTDERVLEELRK